MSDHDKLLPWQIQMMYCDNGHHKVTKNYNRLFYQLCQQEEDDVGETSCDACEQDIGKNCIYSCTVTDDNCPVLAAEPDQISNNWYCRHQGCGYFCTDCIKKYKKKTNEVMQMHIGMIPQCPVYWKKFRIKRCKNSSNIYLVSL